MTALKDLEKRLEEATGPDRELDAAVMRACGLKVYPYDEPSGTTWGDAWAITSSLDAATKVAERVLPGWSWHTMNKDQEENDPHKFRDTPRALLHAGHTTSSSISERRWFSAHAATPALALCLCIIRALIAKGGASG